jgi:hypothetical protein
LGGDNILDAVTLISCDQNNSDGEDWNGLIQTLKVFVADKIDKVEVEVKKEVKSA